MRPRKLLERLSSGSFANVSFKDAINLARGLGFEIVRISGSHHILKHPDVPEVLNLQNERGRAKPYQLRQIIQMIERYHLQPRNR